MRDRVRGIIRVEHSEQGSCQVEIPSCTGDVPVCFRFYSLTLECSALYSGLSLIVDFCEFIKSAGTDMT